MVECPNCGKEVGDNNFCGNCGTKIDKSNVCPECNTELDDESVFCPQCGKKVKEDLETEEKKETEETKTEETEPEDKKETEETTEETEPEDKKETEETTEETEPEDNAHCPFCNTKIDEETEFCPECGKSISLDKQSFEGIRATIKLKKIIVVSIISLILLFILSIAFTYIFAVATPKADYYCVGFFMSLLIVVGIFGSFRDLINGGLLGIINGLVLGLFAAFIVEMCNGYSFSYELLSGYGAVIFTIFGLIVGIISSKYLRKRIVKHIDVENLF